MKTKLIDLTKRFWLTTLVCLLILSSCTQKTSPSKEVSETAEERKSLLWEISGNDLEQPSYLYGTIHIICEDDFRVSDNLKAVFAKTEQVALEVDLSDPSEMQAFQTGMMDLAGIDYQGMLSEEDYAKLDGIVKKTAGVGLAQMKVVKPFGIMSMMYGEVLNCGTPSSYETTFMQMAKEQEKEMSGLESAASQVAIFDNIPQKEQIEWIKEMMNEPEKSKEEFGAMVANYKEQDLEALFATMSESPEYADFEKELLDNRNTAWIPVIEKLASDKSTFIAVGAMHLGGKIGVIKLLRDAGYTVTPVEN